MFPHLYLAFRLYSFYLEILCFIIAEKFYGFPADPLSRYDNRASRWIEISVFQRNMSFAFLPRNLFFVGIPLPGTGAWTGALAASLLGIDWKKAFGAIVVGVCMASVIMYILSYVVIGGIFG